MANELSIKVGTDARTAARDIDKLRGTIANLNTEARRLGTGFTAGASQAEAAMGRLQSRMARLRAEVQHTAAATSRIGGGRGSEFGGGLASSLPGGGALSGGAAGVGAAVGALAVSAAYTGYDELRSQAQAEAFLASAARQTGQAYAAQVAEVQKLRRELGLTTAQATELQAATLRFTATIGRPQDAGRLSRSLANALAASGRSTSEIPDRIRQLQTGQDELFDVIGPVKIGGTFAGSPEAIYKAYAREILNVNRELTDLEKTQARYYAVLQAGEASVGAAAERMASSVGQIDRLTNAFKDLTGSIVGAIAASKGFKTLTGAANSAAGGISTSGPFAQRTISGAFGLSGVAELNLEIARMAYASVFGASEAPQGLGKIGRSLAQQGRSLLDMFGVGGPPSFASTLSDAYKGNLDNRWYLSRDPFGGVRTSEQNELLTKLAKLRSGALGFAGGLSSAYGGIIGAGDILAGLNGGETPSERAARIFSASGRIAGDAASAYRLGGFSTADARSMAEAEARRFRISSLGSVGPGELSADQEAAYRDDLLKYQEDQAKQLREQLLTAIKMEKHLAKLAGQVPDEDLPPQPQVIQIDNRSDTVARFAAIAQGDTLRNDF